MNQSVRTRFAPSPTGLLHVGGLRTALFNYLFAKHHNGEFILRLEDTDRERFVKESVQHIEDGLTWTGLIPDEGYWLGEHKGNFGPYVQSERLPEYKKYAQELVERGLAYYSRISAEEFEKLKQAAISAHKPFAYKQDMEPQNGSETKGYPIRLKVPEGTTIWQDEIRGEFKTDNDLIDDFVILKADGYPTYNFANVIDDHAMKISHVIRGEEFIASSAKHAILYDLFKWERPKFIHLPVILGPDGKKKLSKRDGDVDVLSYQKQGYLAAALVNFLALLGWNDGTEQEIFSLEQLIEKFDITRVQKSPAVFDLTRLDWMNGEYIRMLNASELIDLVSSWLPDAWLKNKEYLSQVIILEQERIKKLSEVPQLLGFFFDEPEVNTELLYKKDSKDQVRTWLEEVIATLNDSEFTHDELEKTLRDLAQKLDITPGQLFYAIRVAITGRTEAPGLFDTLQVLGKEKSLARLSKILKT